MVRRRKKERKYHKPDIWHLIWWQILIPCELDHQEITLGNKLPPDGIIWDQSWEGLTCKNNREELLAELINQGRVWQRALSSVCSAQCALSSVCSVWQCAQLSVHCSSQRALGSVHTSVQCLSSVCTVCSVWAALLPPSTAAEVELSMPALHSRPKELAWWKWFPWKWFPWRKFLPWKWLTERAFLKKGAHPKELAWWKWLTWRKFLPWKRSLEEKGSLKGLVWRKGLTGKSSLEESGAKDLV